MRKLWAVVLLDSLHPPLRVAAQWLQLWSLVLVLVRVGVVGGLVRGDVLDPRDLAARVLGDVPRAWGPPHSRPSGRARGPDGSWWSGERKRRGAGPFSRQCPAKGMSRMDAIILRGSRVVGVVAVREVGGAAAPPLGSAKFRFSSLRSVVNDRNLGSHKMSVSCRTL